MIGKVKNRAQHRAAFTAVVDQSSGRLSVILSLVCSPYAEYPTAPNTKKIAVMQEKPVVKVARNCSIHMYSESTGSETSHFCCELFAHCYLVAQQFQLETQAPALPGWLKTYIT